MTNTRYAFGLCAIGVLCSTTNAPAKETVMVPTPDGTLLATDIFRKDDTPRPVRVMRGCSVRTGDDTAGNAVETSGQYDLVYQDMRTAECTPDGTIFIFSDDGGDGRALLSYIKTQPWSNGHVSMQGWSHGGIVDYLAAPGADSTLVGTDTNYATGDILHYGFFNGGVWHRETGDLLSYAVESWEHYVARPEWSTDYLVTDAQAATVNSVGLHLGGWFDVFGQGTIDSFTRIQAAGGVRARNHQKLIIGPWIHGGTQTTSVGELSFPSSPLPSSPYGNMINDAWQTGVFTGDFTAWNALPTVMVYVMGPTDQTGVGNDWETYTSWPPPATQLPLYFESDHSIGVLSSSTSSLSFTSNPSAPTPTRCGTNNLLSCVNGTCGPCDQKSIEGRSDLLVFTTGVNAAAGKMIGRIHADLWITTDLPDVDLFVRMTDVYPDGRSMLMAQGIQRARYRNGTCPQLLQPGVPALVRVDLSSTALVLGAGHKLRVIVSASADPLYAVNPQNGDDYVGAHPTRTGAINILTGGSTASSIVVPVAGAGTPPDERPVTVSCNIVNGGLPDGGTPGLGDAGTPGSSDGGALGDGGASVGNATVDGGAANLALGANDAPEAGCDLSRSTSSSTTLPMFLALAIWAFWTRRKHEH
jgi:predicted acyl esterase